MASLNVDLDYFDHPKTKRLVGLLGRGAEVLPLKLWKYCGKFHAQDGRLADYSPQEIEAVVEWWGKAGDAVRAMVKVGFLDPIDGGGSDGVGDRVAGYQAHDWSEWQGHIEVFRERSKKAAAARWAKARGETARGQPPDDGCSKHASSTAQASGKQSPCCAVQCNSPPSPPAGGRPAVGDAEGNGTAEEPRAGPRLRRGKPTKRDELLEALRNRPSVNGSG